MMESMEGTQIIVRFKDLCTREEMKELICDRFKLLTRNKFPHQGRQVVVAVATDRVSEISGLLLQERMVEDVLIVPECFPPDEESEEGPDNLRKHAEWFRKRHGDA